MSFVKIGTYGSYWRMKNFGFSENEVEKYLSVFREDEDNLNSLVGLCLEMDLDFKESRKFILRRTIEEHPRKYLEFFKPDNYQNVLSYAGMI